jgi:hypothetical protein
MALWRTIGFLVAFGSNICICIVMAALSSVVVVVILQAGRSRVRAPMTSLDIINLPNPPGSSKRWGLLSLSQK